MGGAALLLNVQLRWPRVHECLLQNTYFDINVLQNMLLVHVKYSTRIKRKREQDMRGGAWGGRGEGNGAKSCCLGGGARGTPHRDSWPSGRGAVPGEESMRSASCSCRGDGIRKPSVKEIVLGHNKAVICRIWCSSQAGAGLPGEWILREGTALHTHAGTVTPLSS